MEVIQNSVESTREEIIHVEVEGSTEMIGNHSEDTEVDQVSQDIQNLDFQSPESNEQEESINSKPNLSVDTTPRKKTASKIPVISPRPQSPKKTQKSVFREDYTVKPSPPVKGASDRLLRTTAARVNDKQSLEVRKTDKERAVSPPKKKPENYTPSSRLLTTTQARVADVRGWEEHREKAKFEDDIWWEARKPHATCKSGSVPSRLYDTTTAYDSGKRPKHISQKVDSPPSTPTAADRVKINERSPLLKPTTAVLYNAWKVEPPKPEQPALVFEAANSGPTVQTKLNAETAAYVRGKYKSKEEREQEELQARPASPTRKVAEVSARLLDLNTNLKAAARPKVRKTDGDPREQGWRKSYSRSEIPHVDLSVPLPTQGGKTIKLSSPHRSPGGTVYSETSRSQDRAENQELQFDDEENDVGVEEEEQEEGEGEEEEELDAQAQEDERVHAQVIQQVLQSPVVVTAATPAPAPAPAAAPVQPVKTPPASPPQHQQPQQQQAPVVVTTTTTTTTSHIPVPVKVTTTPAAVVVVQPAAVQEAAAPAPAVSVIPSTVVVDELGVEDEHEQEDGAKE